MKRHFGEELRKLCCAAFFKFATNIYLIGAQVVWLPFSENRIAKKLRGKQIDRLTVRPIFTQDG